MGDARDPVLIHLGERLRRHRRSHDCDQAMVADVFGVHQTTVSLWEHGRIDPGAARLVAFAELFDAAYDDLLPAPGVTP